MEAIHDVIAPFFLAILAAHPSYIVVHAGLTWTRGGVVKVKTSSLISGPHYGGIR